MLTLSFFLFLSVSVSIQSNQKNELKSLRIRMTMVVMVAIAIETLTKKKQIASTRRMEKHKHIENLIGLQLRAAVYCVCHCCIDCDPCGGERSYRLKWMKRWWSWLLHNKNDCHAMKTLRKSQPLKQMTKHIPWCDRKIAIAVLHRFSFWHYFRAVFSFFAKQKEEDAKEYRHKQTRREIEKEQVGKQERLTELASLAQQWFVIFIKANPLRMNWRGNVFCISTDMLAQRINLFAALKW